MRGPYDRGRRDVAERITRQATRSDIHVVPVSQIAVRYVVYPGGVACATAAEARRVVRAIEQEQDDDE